MLYHGSHRDYVHVATRKNGNDFLTFKIKVLQSGNGKQAGILDNHLMVFNHIKESNDKFVIFDSDDLIEIFLYVGEDLVTWFLHCSAVSDGANVRKLYYMASFKRGFHACCTFGLNSDNLDPRVEHFRQSGNARCESAASDWHQDSVYKGKLLHDFHGD